MYINQCSSPSTPPYKTCLLLILFAKLSPSLPRLLVTKRKRKGVRGLEGVDHTHSPLPGRGVGKQVSVGEQRFYQLRDNENICKEDKTQLNYQKEKLVYFNDFSVLSTGYNNFQFIYFVINITCQYANQLKSNMEYVI